MTGDYEAEQRFSEFSAATQPSDLADITLLIAAVSLLVCGFAWLWGGTPLPPQIWLASGLLNLALIAASLRLRRSRKPAART